MFDGGVLINVLGRLKVLLINLLLIFQAAAHVLRLVNNESFFLLPSVLRLI